jgi:hypothetical protein
MLIYYGEAWEGRMKQEAVDVLCMIIFEGKSFTLPLVLRQDTTPLISIG